MVGRWQDKWITLGPWFPLSHVSPPAPLNLNDFLPLNSPGAFFSPHPSPERLSHSFPAGFHTPGHKVWPVPKSPSYGCHPCPGSWGWDPYPGADGTTVLAVPSCIASCLLPMLSLWPFHPPRHACCCAPRSMGALPASSVSPAYPTPIPHLILSSVSLDTNLAFG